MLQAPLNLSCFEYRRHLKGGVTNPLVGGAARDASGESVEVVLKVRKPESRRSFRRRISSLRVNFVQFWHEALSVSVPDYAVVEVPRELISQGYPAETARRVLANNVDLIWLWSYLPGRTSWYPALAPPGGTPSRMASTKFLNVRRNSYQRRPQSR